eukprot:s1476_g14.t1
MAKANLTHGQQSLLEIYFRHLEKMSLQKRSRRQELLASTGVGRSTYANEYASGVGRSIYATEYASGVGLSIYATEYASGVGLSIYATEYASGVGLSIYATEYASGIGRLEAVLTKSSTKAQEEVTKSAVEAPKLAELSEASAIDFGDWIHCLENVMGEAGAGGIKVKNYAGAVVKVDDHVQAGVSYGEVATAEEDRGTRGCDQCE